MLNLHPKKFSTFFEKNREKHQTRTILANLNLNPHNFALLRKTIVIWTPERESAREDNRKATNNDIRTFDFVFVEILGVAR